MIILMMTTALLLLMFMLMEKEDDVNDDKRLRDGRANHCAVPEGHHKNQKNLVRLPQMLSQVSQLVHMLSRVAQLLLICLVRSLN